METGAERLCCPCQQAAEAITMEKHLCGAGAGAAGAPSGPTPSRPRCTRRNRRRSPPPPWAASDPLSKSSIMACIPMQTSQLTQHRLSTKNYPNQPQNMISPLSCQLQHKPSNTASGLIPCAGMWSLRGVLQQLAPEQHAQEPDVHGE